MATRKSHFTVEPGVKRRARKPSSMKYKISIVLQSRCDRDFGRSTVRCFSLTKAIETGIMWDRISL